LAKKYGFKRVLVGRPNIPYKKQMKKIGNLIEKIVSIENLQLADEHARRGKLKSYGVRIHDKNKEENIKELRKTLLEKRFKTSEYHIFKIYEPKERDIYRLPYYPDRILHHAIMNILEPIWVSLMTKDTFSCLKRRGIHGAMRAVETALKDKQGTGYCLKIDIRKYYPSIDHEVLKIIIRKKIKCKETLNLLDEIIDSAPGVPIGNYLSQYFANLYLAYFDHYVKEVLRVKYYFRYADDMVFLSDNKKYLHGLLVSVNDYIENELKLSLKSNYQIFPIEKRGLDFVGFVFYHDYKLLRKSIKQNFCRKAAKLQKRKLTAKEYKMGISSYLGWLKYTDSKHLYKKILKNYENNL